MNTEEPYRDQAERLKQRIQKINDQIEDGEHLPPREQLHRQKRMKTKWKLKYPVIRLLVLFFILLPVIIFSVVSYLDKKNISIAEKTSGKSVGYETINLENSKNEVKSTNKTVQPTETGKNKQETDGLSSTEEKKEESGDVGQQQENQVKPDSSVSGPNSNVGTVNPQATDKNSPQPVQTKPSQAPSKPSTSKVIYHTVQPHETLYKLAIKYYHSANGINIIKQANNLKSDQINAGQVLKIPLSK